MVESCNTETCLLREIILEISKKVKIIHFILNFKYYYYSLLLLFFKDCRLEEEEFKGCLRKVKDDKTKYYCILCNKNFPYLLQEDVF